MTHFKVLHSFDKVRTIQDLHFERKIHYICSFILNASAPVEHSIILNLPIIKCSLICSKNIYKTLNFFFYAYFNDKFKLHEKRQHTEKAEKDL